MPKQVDVTAQREQIRGAARRVFARRGVPGTGLAHVAREAGMGRSSLYHYYPDKAALLGDLVADALAGERALFRACLGGDGTVGQRLARLVDGCVGMFDEWAALGRLFIDLRLRDVEGFKAYFHEIREDLAIVLIAGQARGEVAADVEPRLAAATLIGAIDGLLIQHFLDTDAFDPEALRDELGRIARRVIAP